MRAVQTRTLATRLLGVIFGPRPRRLQSGWRKFSGALPVAAFIVFVLASFLQEGGAGDSQSRGVHDHRLGSDACRVRTGAGDFDMSALRPRVQIQSKGWTFHTSACANLSAPEEFCLPPVAGNRSAAPVWAISPDSTTCFAVGNLATEFASYNVTNQSLTILYTGGTLRPSKSGRKTPAAVLYRVLCADHFEPPIDGSALPLASNPNMYLIIAYSPYACMNHSLPPYGMH